MKILAKLLAALVLLLALLALGGLFDRPPVGAGVLASPPGEPAPTQRAEARLASWPAWHRAPARLASRQRVEVAPRIGGRVLELGAALGQTVEAGDLLARLDDRSGAARLAQAGAAVDSARAEVERAERAWERTRALREREAATPEALEAAVAGRAAARAGLAAAEQARAEAEVAHGHAVLHSPLDGVVAAREAEVGELAAPGRLLFVIHDPEALRVEAELPERLLGRVEVGSPLLLELDGERVELRASEVAPAVDPASRSFHLRADLEARTGWRPGRFARLVVPLDERAVVVVPQEAPRQQGQLDTLLVRQGGRWVRRVVTLGEARDGEVEVLSGVAAGETVGWDG